jgi:hypothetical protein
MRGAVVRKRPSGVERVSEHGSLGSRVPESRWDGLEHGAAVTGRAPGPLHCVAGVNRHR